MYQVEYKSDMKNNYMILNQGKEKQKSDYGINMITHNRIPGLLKMEIRVMDNINWYYYDITSKHPISMVFEKGQLSREQIRLVMWNILQVVEKSKEYLLDENDFILEPEYVFVNLPRLEINLCHKVGHQKDIRSQISKLIEYFMNKVDHREEGAALLIYSLYKVSREENCTFAQLLELLRQEEMESEKKDSKENYQELGRIKESRVESNYTKSAVKAEEPVLKTEEEIKVYAKHTFYYCLISVVLTLLIFFGAAKAGFVYNKITNGLDYTKAFALLAIVGGVEAYILLQLLSEKNKIIKIKKRAESKVKIGGSTKEIKSHPSEILQKPSITPGNIRTREEVFLPYEENTMVLSVRREEEFYRLCSLEDTKYEDILLTEFPFFIGALKMKVDYSIEHPSISRFHAKLDREGEVFYITDLNSTNGTYINTSRLGIQERRQIQLEDEIAFADIRYRFTFC